MHFAQRFTLMVKGSLNALLDQWEDPERSLDQLILDMEEQLEVAKRAAAQAMANEDRLRAAIAFQHKDQDEWRQAARRALERGREEDAREALRRAEQAKRQAQRLGDQLASQEKDTRDIRASVTSLHEKLGQARARLNVLRARLRQSEARRAMGQAMAKIERADLYSEFDRIGERVERDAAAERAYLQLDDRLSGQDVRRRFEEAAMDDLVEDGLDALRHELATAEAETSPAAPTEGGAGDRD